MRNSKGRLSFILYNVVEQRSLTGTRLTKSMTISAGPRAA